MLAEGAVNSAVKGLMFVTVLMAMNVTVSNVSCDDISMASAWKDQSMADEWGNVLLCFVITYSLSKSVGKFYQFPYLIITKLGQNLKSSQYRKLRKDLDVTDWLTLWKWSAIGQRSRSNNGVFELLSNASSPGLSLQVCLSFPYLAFFSF